MRMLGDSGGALLLLIWPVPVEMCAEGEREVPTTGGNDATPSAAIPNAEGGGEGECPRRIE